MVSCLDVCCSVWYVCRQSYVRVLCSLRVVCVCVSLCTKKALVAEQMCGVLDVLVRMPALVLLRLDLYRCMAVRIRVTSCILMCRIFSSFLMLVCGPRDSGGDGNRQSTI